MTWTVILVGAAACYLCKLVGLLVPLRVLARPRVHQVASLLPVTLLAALVAVQTLTSGAHLVLDTGAAAITVAMIAVLLRAPLLLVVVLAAVTASLLRLAG